MKKILYAPMTLGSPAALELPERKWVVEGLLPKGSLTLFSAREKAGKSMLAFHLAACVALVLEFLGRDVTPGPVLIVPTEEHLREVRNRLLQLVDGNLEAEVHVLPVNRGEIGVGLGVEAGPDQVDDADRPLLKSAGLEQFLRSRSHRPIAELLLDDLQPFAPPRGRC